MKIDGVFPKSYIIPMSALDLPTLTTLHLDFITLYDENTDDGIGLFSKCPNLKNLTLSWFKIMRSNCFSICHTLSNLTLKSNEHRMEVVIVVAPQLENLTIRSTIVEFVISAPKLNSLLYKGSRPLKLSSNGFRSLEKANICVSKPRIADAHQIVYLLQQLHSVKFLSLNSDIGKVCWYWSLMFIYHVPLAKICNMVLQ